MNSQHIHYSTGFFTPYLTVMPPIVEIFTYLRQGEFRYNELHYPELHFSIPANDMQLSGHVASKLTAALSVHLDNFLGLSCQEDKAGEQTDFVARFFYTTTPDAITEEINVKAPDMIDTLLALH